MYMAIACFLLPNAVGAINDIIAFVMLKWLFRDSVWLLVPVLVPFPPSLSFAIYNTNMCCWCHWCHMTEVMLQLILIILTYRIQWCHWWYWWYHVMPLASQVAPCEQNDAIDDTVSTWQQHWYWWYHMTEKVISPHFDHWNL